MKIEPGTMFSTPFEVGCVALEAPDPEFGGFEGTDSDGVVCLFNASMVTATFPSERITRRPPAEVAGAVDAASGAVSSDADPGL